MLTARPLMTPPPEAAETSIAIMIFFPLPRSERERVDVSRLLALEEKQLDLSFLVFLFAMRWDRSPRVSARSGAQALSVNRYHGPGARYQKRESSPSFVRLGTVQRLLYIVR
jgi:hypothetical protein